MLFISWSYRCQKYTASAFSLLVKIFVRLIMVSIILPSRQRDTPVFKYKLRMAPMWVICNSNLLEQLNTKAKIHILIELWHFNSKRIEEKILAISVWDESSKLRLRQLQHILNWKLISLIQGEFHMALSEHVICGGQICEKMG